MNIDKIDVAVVEKFPESVNKVCGFCTGIGSTCRKCDLKRICNYLYLKSEKLKKGGLA